MQTCCLHMLVKPARLRHETRWQDMMSRELWVCI